MSAGYLRGCAGKKQYADKSEARIGRVGLAGYKKVTLNQLTVYRCDQCLKWHVGGARRVFVTRTKTGRRPNKRLRGRV